MKSHHLVAALLATAAVHCQAAPANDAALRAELAEQAVEPDEKRTVISYVSPGDLFPVEELKFARRGQPATAEKYRPLPAYDKPNGKKVGEVRMTNGRCASTRAPGCDEEPMWYLQLVGDAPYRLAVTAYDGSTSALLTYRDSVRDNDKVWSEIEFNKGTFWVATSAASVASYESLVTYANKFDTWCSAPGTCKAVDKRMRADMESMADADNQCYAVVYNISGVVTEQGKQYYKAKLGTLGEDNKGSKLPKSGYIPVRNKDGSHTGWFYNGDC